ncbi:putative wall-associated receptor kinase, galacturonan-binding domain-containing protein [Helianthus debilis subsp. tardiflorus]
MELSQCFIFLSSIPFTSIMVSFILFVVSLFLMTFAHPSLSTNGCPKCGTMRVPYPLSTSENCGNPKYKLHCNTTTGLEFISAEQVYYTITSIDSKARRLVLRPPLIDQGTCQSSDLRVGGFRLEDDSPFNISSRNTVLLLNCSENILLSPLDCSSSSICRRFEEKESVCAGLLCCSFLKDASMTNHRIRVRVEGCSAYTSLVNLTPGALIDSWKFGIELQWVQPL